MRDKKTLQYIGQVNPVITEKALQQSEGSYVVFQAPTSATKKNIKDVIEYLYKDSKVLKVNSVLSKGKVKRFRGKIGQRAATKKFFVKLDKPIDITTGIK